MEVDQIINDSLQYAKSSWRKVAILGVIYLPIFIMGLLPRITQLFTDNFIIYSLIFSLTGIISLVIGFFYSGYLFRVIKDSLAGINELPNFDEFTEMFIDGIKVFLVTVVYGLIYAIIAVIVVVGVIIVALISILASGLSSTLLYNTYYIYSEPSIMIGAFAAIAVVCLALFLGILIIITITVLYEIIIAMAISNMASKGNIIAAFSISDIQERINNIRWSKAILWFLGVTFVSMIGMLVSMILGFLLIGLIIVPLIVVPYLAIFRYRSIALLFEEGE